MDINALHMAMTAMSDPEACAKEVAQRLGVTTATLYNYVNGDGSVKAAGQRLLDKARKWSKTATNKGWLIWNTELDDHSSYPSKAIGFQSCPKEG